MAKKLAGIENGRSATSRWRALVKGHALDDSPPDTGCFSPVAWHLANGLLDTRLALLLRTLEALALAHARVAILFLARWQQAFVPLNVPRDGSCAVLIRDKPLLRLLRTPVEVKSDTEVSRQTECAARKPAKTSQNQPKPEKERKRERVLLGLCARMLQTVATG